MDRPNIVIFNPDQMRADSLGHLGNPARITPNLDAFAQNDAVSFRNAFCQNPVCTPSRCSFLTGLYPHVHGHRTMNHMLSDDTHSIFRQLKESGYYVWMNARNDFLPAQEEGVFEKNADTFFMSNVTLPKPEHDEPPITDPDKSGFYSFYLGKMLGREGQAAYTKDDLDVNGAIDFIDNGRPKDKPFCLFLGLSFPHPPYQVEDPYFSAVDPGILPARIPTPEDVGKLPRILRGLLENMNLGELTEAEWNKIRTCYLGMCMKVDAQFGRICDALKRQGIYDDTDIYVLSDHGDFTGDYGLSEKAQNYMPDCLVNVPLLIKPHKGVDIVPGVRDCIVELIDFYATAMELCGVVPDHTQFGMSLLGVMAEPTCELREYAFCEGGRLACERVCCTETGGVEPARSFSYWPRLSLQNVDDVAHTKATMIRSKRYKYVRRLYELDEFYDLEADPDEVVNRIDDSAYAPEIDKMRMAMLNWYQETCDIVPFAQDSRFSAEMILRQFGASTNLDEKTRAMFIERFNKNPTDIGLFFRFMDEYRQAIASGTKGA